jgi:hypothetical protein
MYGGEHPFLHFWPDTVTDSEQRHEHESQQVDMGVQGVQCEVLSHGHFQPQHHAHQKKQKASQYKHTINIFHLIFFPIFVLNRPRMYCEAFIKEV